jgi:acyl carrier protein
MSFEDIGMDSLALMELSIWVQLETGLELPVARLAEIAGVSGLTRLLSEPR